MDQLSHTDESGRAAMVDVGHKTPQRRTAKAAGYIQMKASTILLIEENKMKKGDVLTVAEIAGVQAAKRTFELIPLCHLIPISNIQVKAKLKGEGVSVESEVSSTGQTGVEMEALTAVSVALLTVYDMCKAVDQTMKIGEIVLLEKQKTDLD